MDKQIIFIGSVHEPTPLITPADIVAILEQHRIEVILLEFPPEWESQIDRIMNMTEHSTIECQAANIYRQSHSVTFHCMDIAGRNNYFMESNYFENLDAWCDFKEIYFSSEPANPAALALESTIQKAWNVINDATTGIFSGTLQTINSPQSDELVELNHYIMREAALMQFDLVPEFQPYRASWMERSAFDDRRNQAMINNIVKFCAEYPDQNIAVLCVCYHRFALVKGIAAKGITTI